MKKIVVLFIILANFIYASTNENFIKVIEEGNISNLKILIKNNIEVKLDEIERTPLMKAVQLNNLKIVKFLIEAGANINVKSRYNESILDYAVENNSIEMADLIIKEGLNSKKIINKAFLKSNSKEMIIYLLEKGANIDYIEKENDHNYTLLMNLISENKFQLVDFLLKKGANTNIKDNKGENALFCIYEAIGEAEKFGDLLIKNGIKIDEKNNEGNTVLSKMVLEDDLKLAEYFISKGADIRVQNNDKKTLIDLAESEDMKKLIKRESLYYEEIENIEKGFKSKTDLIPIINKLENAGIKEILAIKPYRFTQTQYIQVINNYAYFLSETERYKEAIPILENVIKLSSKRAVAYLNLGDCYYKEYLKNADKNTMEKVKYNYQQYKSLLNKNANIPERVKKIIE